jgi:hypothetical protein
MSFKPLSFLPFSFLMRQVHFKLVILLIHFPECWDYRVILPHWASRPLSKLVLFFFFPFWCWEWNPGPYTTTYSTTELQPSPSK